MWDDGEEHEHVVRRRDWIAAALMTIVVTGALLGALAVTVQSLLTNVLNNGQ